MYLNYFSPYVFFFFFVLSRGDRDIKEKSSLNKVSGRHFLYTFVWNERLKKGYWKHSNVERNVCDSNDL